MRVILYKNTNVMHIDTSLRKAFKSDFSLFQVYHQKLLFWTILRQGSVDNHVRGHGPNGYGHRQFVHFKNRVHGQGLSVDTAVHLTLFCRLKMNLLRMILFLALDGFYCTTKLRVPLQARRKLIEINPNSSYLQ